MTPTTIQKIRDKTGYSLETFIQVVQTEYRNQMSLNQIGRKYGVNHKLVGEILRIGGGKPRQRLDAVRLFYKQKIAV